MPRAASAPVRGALVQHALAALTDCLQQAAAAMTEVRQMLAAGFAQLNADHGFSLQIPPEPSLAEQSARLQALGVIRVGNSAAEFQTFMGSEFELYKKIIQDAAIEAGKYQRQVSRDLAASQLADLKKAGMQVTELPAAEVAKLREKMAPVITKNAASVGEATIKDIQAELAKLRK